MSESESRLSGNVFEPALTVATRALARAPDLEIDYASGPARAQGNHATLPRPSPNLTTAERARLRGAGDAVAVKLRHHQDKVHSHYRPHGSSAGAIFDALEQARVEALGCLEMPGVAQNLSASLAEEMSGIRPETTTRDTQIALAARLSLREAADGVGLPEEARQALANCPDVSQVEFSKLIDSLQWQVDFARLARSAISTLGYSEELGEDPDDTSEPEPDSASDANDLRSEIQEVLDNLPDTDTDDESTEVVQQAMQGEMSDESETGDAKEENPQDLPATPPGGFFNSSDYTVYCREFDQIADAATLCDAAELDRHHLNLNRQVEPLRNATGRLANRLQRRLQARQSRSWRFDLEEGLLDTGRLARVVATPLSPLSFKREHEAEFRDTIVTLLLDNSGSMRGRPIATAAVCAEVLGRTLERCGVRVEILGFTTRAWKGGLSRERWLANQRQPARPGRLNDLLHIAYKTAEAPWRRSRRNLGLMLREGLLKENIDGEALEWAHSRLVARPERRKILLVISDGAPVDDTTLAVNGAGYLEKHLRDVVAGIEKWGQVELIAIGIGHDVTRYYQNAITINTAEQLAGAIADQLAELFEQTPPHEQAASRKNHMSKALRRRPRRASNSPMTPTTSSTIMSGHSSTVTMTGFHKSGRM